MVIKNVVWRKVVKGVHVGFYRKFVVDLECGHSQLARARVVYGPYNSNRVFCPLRVRCVSCETDACLKRLGVLLAK